MFKFLCDNTRKKQFGSAMRYAKLVSEQAVNVKDNHPILDVVRLLGRNVQTKYLAHMLFCEEKRSELPDITFDCLFFDRGQTLSKDGKMLYDVMKRLESNEW